MAALGHIGLNGTGSVVFRKISYNNGLPERVSSSNTTIDGPNIHIVSSVKDSQKQPSGIIRLGRTDRDTLISIWESSTIILDFDDGENSYKGYLKSLDFVSATNFSYTYRFVFHVTSKIK